MAPRVEKTQIENCWKVHATKYEIYVYEIDTMATTTMKTLKNFSAFSWDLKSYIDLFLPFREALS